MLDSKTLFHMAILLLLVVLVTTSCTFEFIKPPPPIEVVFKSHHGQYVTAMGAGDGWSLKQEPELDNCGRFTQHHLANGKIALVTCYDRYVTAPDNGTTRWDWMLGQESELGKCGQFDLYDLGSDRVAFRTCAGKFFTAGDGGWPPGLEWSIIAETDNMDAWEIFTVLQPYTVAAFDRCIGVTDQEGLIEAIPGSPGDELVVSYVQEAGRGCIARLEYDIVEWSAFWIQLQGADLSPYSQLVFDVKADSHNIPERVKIELKRAGGHEVSILDISGITTDWQTMSVNLSDFGPTSYAPPLSSFTDMEELLFTFDVERSGRTGVIYLDNIALR
jgi:hypothetical protein